RRARCPRNGNRGYGELVTSHRQGRSARQPLGRSFVRTVAFLSSPLPTRSEKIRARAKSPRYVARQSTTPDISKPLIQITFSTSRLRGSNVAVHPVRRSWHAYQDRGGVSHGRDPGGRRRG